MSEDETQDEIQRPSSVPPPDPETRRQRRRRLAFFGIWGALLGVALFAFRGVLLPFFLATVLAYVFAPLVRMMEERSSLPRWGAVVVLYLALLGGIGSFAALGAPRLAVEIETLAREAPEALAEARDQWLPALEQRFRSAMTSHRPGERPPSPASEVHPDAITAAASSPNDAIGIVPNDRGGYEVRLPPGGLLVESEGGGYRIRGRAGRARRDRDLTQAITSALRKLSENTEGTARTLLQTAQSVARAIVKGIFTFFIMLMLSAYMLITSERILRFFRSLWPQARQRSFDRLVLRIDRGLGGVVRGQLLIALVNGILSGIGFYILDLRYWPILTLIATLLSVIPIFGAILSSVPAVIIGLQSGVGTSLLVFGWIVLIHQIEANILNPKIMGDAAKVHPVLVVFALLAGEHVYGIAGALLAVPVLSILQSLFLHYREVMLGVPART